MPPSGVSTHIYSAKERERERQRERGVGEAIGEIGSLGMHGQQTDIGMAVWMERKEWGKSLMENTTIQTTY
jgi:hypothetical protein